VGCGAIAPENGRADFFLGACSGGSFLKGFDGVMGGAKRHTEKN
jgi:hypothetical protein